MEGGFCGPATKQRMRLSPAPLALTPTLSQREREQNRQAFFLQNVFFFCY